MARGEQSADDRKVMNALAARALGTSDRKNPSDVRKEAAVSRKMTRSERK